MVFCRQCGKRVDDCPHFVFPIKSPRVRVYDEKVEALAYNEQSRTLEIAFKSGQVWQLFDVPAGIYHELQSATISSFLKFIAQRYKSAPVKTGLNAVIVPAGEQCMKCEGPMSQGHRINNAFDEEVRVLWKCSKENCGGSFWKSYSAVYSGRHRERKGRWR